MFLRPGRRCGASRCDDAAMTAVGVVVTYDSGYEWGNPRPVRAGYALLGGSGQPQGASQTSTRSWLTRCDGVIRQPLTRDDISEMRSLQNTGIM